MPNRVDTLNKKAADLRQYDQLTEQQIYSYLLQNYPIALVIAWKNQANQNLAKEN